KVFEAGEEETRAFAIMSIPDEAKGEALVLLSTREIDLNDLRSRLASQGLPNLWIPKIVHRVDSIPSLGSGKLDLGGCKALVKSLIS
ncbi:MAG: AMP-dependent synthetase, partial [Verrucomicrobiia bacterium]